MRRYKIAYLIAYIARVLGFTLTVIIFGWDADPPSIALGFQCAYSFFLISAIAIMAFLGETVFNKVFHLPSRTQIFLWLLIFLGIGTSYILIIFPGRDYILTNIVPILTGFYDIVLPGMTYCILLALFRPNDSH